MYCIDIVLLQETKTTLSSDLFLKSVGGSFITIGVTWIILRHQVDNLLGGEMMFLTTLMNCWTGRGVLTQQNFTHVTSVKRQLLASIQVFQIVSDTHSLTVMESNHLFSAYLAIRENSNYWRNHVGTKSLNPMAKRRWKEHKFLFHHMANRRRSKNHISLLKVNGEKLSNHNAISNAFFNFFHERLGTLLLP